jgi:SulP family sulfate permease
VIVGIVALPLAIAFAIASGVKPEQGLYTAIIAGLTISILGGSRVQIGGPTGAFIVIIYGIVQQYGYDGLAIATVLAGILLILMGVFRLGQLLKFIPYPVVIGFTGGVAIIIFSSEVRDLFGLHLDNIPADFTAKWETFATHAQTFNPTALGIALFSILVIALWPRITRRIPGSIVAIIVTTAVVQIFHLDVETIGSRFGSVPTSLPAPQMPHLTWALITKMFSPAVTIALLAAIESLLSAVVADGMAGTRHRSNMELIAQGAANILSPIFGGIPATGAIARTATNIKNGGRTPIAGIIHALTLLLIMLAFGQWAALIPMATLAAVLVVVSYHMSEWRMFVKIFKSPKSDIAILLSTFLLTVFIDLTVAIEVGVVLAAFLFMKRMMETTQSGYITNELKEEDEEDDPQSVTKRVIPPGVEVFEIHGALFFAAIEQFKDAINIVERKPKVFILRMRDVLAIDATGIQALEDLYKKMTRQGTQVIFSGVHAQPLVAMQQSGLLDKIGEEWLTANIDEALEQVRKILEAKKSV